MTKMYQKIHIVLLMMNDMNKFLWMLIRSQRNELQETNARCHALYHLSQDCVSHETRSEYESRSKGSSLSCRTTSQRRLSGRHSGLVSHHVPSELRDEVRLAITSNECHVVDSREREEDGQRNEERNH